MIAQNTELYDHDIFPYIRTTRGSYQYTLNKDPDPLGKDNIFKQLKQTNFLLDTNYFINDPKPKAFKGLSFDNLTTKLEEDSKFSATFRMISTMDTFSFSYQKFFNTFANVMGIMEAIKFCLMVINLLINFSFQNLNFLDFFFSRKIRIYNKKSGGQKSDDLEKSELPSLTIIPFKNTTNFDSTVKHTNNQSQTRHIDSSIIDLRNKRLKELGKSNSSNHYI